MSRCQNCMGMPEHGCYCAGIGAAAPGGPMMTDDEKIAWKLYCEITAGAMSAKDFWVELSPELQADMLQRIQKMEVGPHHPHSPMTPKVYVGPQPALQGSRALVSVSEDGRTVAQFNDLCTGYSAGWHEFQPEDFE